MRAGGGIGRFGSLTAWAARLSSRNVVVTMTVTGSPRCWPSSVEAMPALRPSLSASCSRCGPLRVSGCTSSHASPSG